MQSAQLGNTPSQEGSQASLIRKLSVYEVPFPHPVQAKVDCFLKKLRLSGVVVCRALDRFEGFIFAGRSAKYLFRMRLRHAVICRILDCQKRHTDLRRAAFAMRVGVINRPL